MMLAMTDGEIAFVVIWWIVAAILATWMGHRRGWAGDGLIFGILLGPLGVIVAGLLPWKARAEARHRQDVEDAQERLHRMRKGDQRALKEWGAEKRDEAEFRRWRAGERPGNQATRQPGNEI